MMAQGISCYLIAAAALTCLGSGIDAQEGGYVPSIAVLDIYNGYTVAALSCCGIRVLFQANEDLIMCLFCS